MTAVLFLSTIILSMLSIIQGTWFHSISIFGVAPDLPMLVLLWLSFHNSRGEGPVSGFLSGLVADVLSTSPFGFHAFINTFIAWVASALHGSFHTDNILVPVLFGVGGTVTRALAVWTLSIIFGEAIIIQPIIEVSFWVQAGLNGIFAPILFFGLSKARHYLVTEDRKR